MTAPIRVRGWHTGMKRMISPEELAADQLTLQATGYFINVSSMSTRMSQTFTTTEFVPLLSTGLRDKNGVEIFDGDIMGRGNVVELVNGSWCINGDRDLYMWLDDHQVIGNIYEDPDLLTFPKREEGDEPQAAIAAEG